MKCTLEHFSPSPNSTEIMTHQDCHSVYSSVFENWLHIIQKNSNLYRPVSWDPYFRMPHDQYSIIHAYRIFRDTCTLCKLNQSMDSAHWQNT